MEWITGKNSYKHENNIFPETAHIIKSHVTKSEDIQQPHSTPTKSIKPWI